jgi:tetratricopeptide (TPR) repeat protein
VVAVKRPLFEKAAQAPRLSPDLKDDFPSFFAECLVRAVELKLKRISPGERETSLTADEEGGYVLVRPLFAALKKFEQSEPSMKIFFPDLVRSIDVNVEQSRIAGLHFASVDSPRFEGDPSEEVVARRRAALPVTIPNDPQIIAALTEGERQIAEKNPRAAEASFRKVLAKYPDQTRAWYGLGLVALLDHDGPRAKEIFGHLIAKPELATQDPMVVAWSHIYLARIYDDDGQFDRAKNEYQAAEAVAAGPDTAKQAAKNGLEALDRIKSTQRP